MTKVVHISPVYWENWGYQENMITKKQATKNCNVTVISSLNSIVDYKAKYLKKHSYNEGSVKIIRLDFVFNLFNRFFIYKKLNKTLKELNPDIIMLHGMQSLITLQLIKYKINNPQCTLYSDFHADFTISGTNFLSKYFLHKFIWRNLLKISYKYFDEMYYTRPSVKNFSRLMYKIPLSKFLPLYLGAEYPVIKDKKSITLKFKTENRISLDTVLIGTGGKINKKSNLTQLLDVISKNPKKIILFVFGKVDENYYQENIKLYEKTVEIRYLGWLNNKEMETYFSLFDVTFFLGRHSVLWEQVVGSGNVLAIKHEKDREYLNCNNNVYFILDDYKQSIKNILNSLSSKDALFKKNTSNSQKYGPLKFNYKNIVKNLNKKWNI